ncbi:phosphatidylinositol 4-kinase gamma 4-like [Panicum miliaceum]|uniref:1-phosphatidylinositol 4-kinase n=1 Tax=Panicum miliaceum TaxID=4540 RepID=A0A3L6T1R2_PANMI|nr:phosphatidylinositol 4-kinase gamma 4-like [Panicum miliaceum]
MSSAGAATAACTARDELGLLPLRPAPDGSITIYLTAPGLAVMPMRVMASDSIASVKLRVQTSQGVVVRKQKLVFHGRELARNDCRVRDYGVADGNVLHLVIRIPDLRHITVETVQGSKFRFRVEPGRTVGYVKQQIAKDSRLDPSHPDEQTLVLEGEELDDRHLIHDVCRIDGAVIHLLVQRSAKARDFEVSIVARDAAQTQHQPLPRDIGIEPVVGNPKAQLPKALRDLVSSVRAGMANGNAPIMSSEGTGGAYFMQDASGHQHIAVFKPVDEEPMAANNPRGLPVSSTGEGLKKGTRVGEGALREVAAYILDHPLGGRRSFAGHGAAGFAGVPPTALVRCMHKGFRQPEGSAQPPAFKLGSMQAFVKNCGSCEDMGPRAFPVQEVHKICVLDIRLANADRHAGNILVCRDDEGRSMSLVPIDHGYCLPESFEDCTFEWLYWPQSREPFSGEVAEYVRCLDAEEDIAILRFHGWAVSRECARTLRVATMLLKKGVERGLTAFDIGSILCRETLTKESVIEEMVGEAQALVDDDGARGAGGNETAFLQAVSGIMDRRLDELSSEQK